MTAQYTNIFHASAHTAQMFKNKLQHKMVIITS